MINQLRRDIQSRIDQLLSEADKLRRALLALGGTDADRSQRPADARGVRTGTRGHDARTKAASSPPAASAARRSGSGKTKGAVLDALAGGEAKTASQIAAATGLGRGSVSTTLTRLAKSGQVTKADRGYKLAAPAPSSTTGDPAAHPPASGSAS
ncbi:MAG: MarR family transcriptional regulator [Solirubrobacteraceae bacterium]